jgi:hypothetical protein
MQKLIGDMAVAAGILVQIFLVVFFRGPEPVQRKDFYGQILTCLGSFPVPGFLYAGQQRVILIVDPCPVLDAGVAALAVD